MFKLIDSYQYKDIPKGYYAIDCDPTLKYEQYLFCKKEGISFNEVIDALNKYQSKTELIGYYSLIYFKYYLEFYQWIKKSIEDKNLQNIKIIRRFEKNALNRWIEFIQYSDDTLYPQNNYFMLMKNEILNI